MSNQSNLIELAALWKGTTKAGKQYLSGRLGDARVFIFFTENKQNPKAPDARILVAPNNENRSQGNGQGVSEQGQHSSSEDMPRGQYERKVQSRNRNGNSGGYNPNDNGIPF